MTTEVAAAYNGEFQGFGFGISGGYADESGPNNDVWNVGGYASASGFTLAGGYQDAGEPTQMARLLAKLSTLVRCTKRAHG